MRCCPTTCAARFVAGLHGRPADRRTAVRAASTWTTTTRCCGHAGRSEAQNPAGRQLRAVGPRRAICPETAQYRRDGDGRHEGLPGGDPQGGVPPHSVRRLRGGGDSLGIRHGRTHLASLLAGRQPVPLPGLDARHGTRRQRPVLHAAGGKPRRTEHHRPGQLVVLRLHPDGRHGARRRRRIVRDRGDASTARTSGAATCSYSKKILSHENRCVRSDPAQQPARRRQEPAAAGRRAADVPYSEDPDGGPQHRRGLRLLQRREHPGPAARGGALSAAQQELDRDTTLGREIYDRFTAEVGADLYVLAHATSPSSAPRPLPMRSAKCVPANTTRRSAPSASRPSPGTRGIR